MVLRRAAVYEFTSSRSHRRLGDLVAFRCAASAEQEEADIACIRAHKLVEEILADVAATSYKLFLTGQNNFRKKLDPKYKANRKDKEPPRHLQAVREFLVTQHKAEVCQGYEADDALGMEQKAFGTVICTLDKDLKQVPGHHYNWVKKEFFVVTPDEGLKSFFASSLIGDRSDNIIGVAGIGPVKAERILSAVLPEEYYQTCRKLYNDDERYHRNLSLLWIWRSPLDIWEPPETVHHCGEDAERNEEALQGSHNLASSGSNASSDEGS